MKTKLLLLLTLLVSAFSWGQVNITPSRSAVTGFPAWTDVDVAGTAYIQLLKSTSSTVTPAMDFNGYTNETLDFRARTYGGTTAAEIILTVSISVNDGVDWTVLGTRTPATNTLLAQAQFDLSGYSGTQVKIKFSVAGSNDAIGVGIDAINIRGIAPTCAAPTMSSTVSATQNVTGDIDFTGSVTDAGGGTNITTRGFQISTSNAMTTPTDLSEASTATGGYSLNTILNGNTRYYYRAYAINDCTPAQTGYSSATPVATSIVTKQFSTTANAATNISSSSFTANWTNPGGGTETYTYKLYVTVDDGTGTFIPFATYTAISSATPYYDLTGLTPNTRYRYYFHSNNSAGDSELPSNTIEVITLAPGSDIVVNSSYAYTSNIDYKLYQVATISNTSHSIGVFQFIIRDGGSSALTDSKTTELNAISFNVTNISNIRTAALFFGNTLINASPSITGSSISFSGLSGTDVTALDGSTKSITLRVTFNTIVTDNQQMQFTIASATANTSGTIFDASNAGGATSSITGDRNRIEVTADRLLFVQQPVNTSQNAPMGTAPSVQACDSILPLYGNVDLDYTTAISITSTGTMTGAPISVIPTTGTGVSTFTGIVHTSAGTYTLNATSGTLTTTNSNNFVISPFTFAAGDMRPINSFASTNLSFNGQWEYYNGSAWITSGTYDGRAPQNTTNTVNRVLIDRYVGGGGTTTKSYNCDFIIQSGGFLYIDANITTPTQTFVAAGKKVEVLSGGTLYIDGDILINSTGNLIVRNGGELYLDQETITHSHPIWNGIELFEGGSYVMIYDWNWTVSPGNRSLFNTITSIGNNANGYKFGNLYIDINPTDTWTLIGGGIGIVNLCENDLEIFNSSTNFIHGATNRTGTNGFLVNGNMTIYDGPFSFGASFGNESFNHQFIINGNFECSSDDNLKIHHIGMDTPTALSGNVTFKGDVKIASTVTSFTNDGASGTPARMSVNFENGTLALPKLIDIAPTAVAIPMNIKANSVRKLASQDLTTNSATSYTAPFTVETNGTLHFGWASDGTTPLVIKKTTSSPLGTNSFISQSGSTLILTSLDGLQQAAATTGNVQYTSSNKTFNQTGTFWYVGKNDQATGDVFTSGGSAKTIICDLLDNTKKLTLNSSTSITSPGLLDIRKGQFVETTVALITGSNGGLTMGDGTRYIIPSLSSSSSDLIPRMSGLSSVYNLASNSTIELNGADGINDFDQYLRGNYNYRNLTFSTSGTKTISSSTSSITGTITVANSAKLNVESKTMGGTGTNLTMTGTSEYITAGTGVKPDAQETYTLGNGTKVTFTSGSTAVPISTLQEIRLAPNYYNIDVVGNNVGTNTLASPIKISGTFTVKTNGLFKHSNTNGFNGSSTTAIDNTNSPTITLEDNSTIEYAGANQFITHFSPAYRNLHISGSGNKTLQHNTATRVNENLEVLDLAGNSAILKIGVGEVITVQKAVKVPTTATAKMVIENNGQLIQIEDTDPANLNSGTNFEMKRVATVTVNDYVYWSSPTDDFSVTLIPNSGLRYEWNPIKHNSNGTQGNWIAASSIMAKGKGYIVRVPNPTPTDTTTIFKGTPRNGTVDVKILRGDKKNSTDLSHFNDNWNLVGNPYPSAISALEFLQTNGANLVDTDPSTPTPTIPATTIVGSVWIWKHGINLSNSNPDPFYYNFANNYSSTDYIKFNGTGSTDPSFNGFIGAGQGFMISMKDNAFGEVATDISGNPEASLLINDFVPYENKVVFTNSMRVNDSGGHYDNNQFFRTANAENSVAADDEKHRIWLDIIKTSNGQTDTALIGYVSNATMGEDNLYDTFFMPRNEVSLYSLINTKSYIIQGRSLPFDTTDLVPLGMKIISAGSHTIAIRQVDGIFEGNQNIYLEDKQLNIIHDLKQSPYHFTAPTGVNNTRFVLRYTTNALGNADFDYDNQVIVFSKNNTVTINSSIQNIDEVQVYDVLGRQLYQNTAVENQEHSFAKDIAQQTIIVKVKLQNGIWVTKKVLVK